MKPLALRTILFHIITTIYEETMDLNTKIFNRWGELVYESNSYEGWDGRYQQSEAPEEVYVYIIRVDCKNGDSKTFKGDINLIRID